MKSEYFLWDPNQGMVAVGPRPSVVWLHSLNNSSWTVGEANDSPPGRRMIAWNSSAGMRDLFPLDLPIGHLAGLNDANQILYSERPADRSSWLRRKLLSSRIRRKYFAPHPPCYLWDPHRGRILLDPYVPGGVFGPGGLNNHGCVVGCVTIGTKVRAVLLEPIPERWGK